DVRQRDRRQCERGFAAVREVGGHSAAPVAGRVFHRCTEASRRSRATGAGFDAVKAVATGRLAASCRGVFRVVEACAPRTLATVRQPARYADYLGSIAARGHPSGQRLRLARDPAAHGAFSRTDTPPPLRLAAANLRRTGAMPLLVPSIVVDCGGKSASRK